MSQPARKPLRILEIETFGRGGLTHYAYNLSLALTEVGHDVTLVTAAAYELEGRRGLPKGMRIVKAIGRLSHRFSASSGAGPRHVLAAFALSLLRKAEAVFDSLAVAALARRLRPDVIHLHCTNPIALLYLGALQWLGRPLVATAHVVTPHERIRFQEAVYQRIHRLGHRIIAHSEFDRRRLLSEFAVDPRRVR